MKNILSLQNDITDSKLLEIFSEQTAENLEHNENIKTFDLLKQLSFLKIQSIEKSINFI